MLICPEIRCAIDAIPVRSALTACMRYSANEVALFELNRNINNINPTIPQHRGIQLNFERMFSIVLRHINSTLPFLSLFNVVMCAKTNPIMDDRTIKNINLLTN